MQVKGASKTAGTTYSLTISDMSEKEFDVLYSHLDKMRYSSKTPTALCDILADMQSALDDVQEH